jgi:hypothetical protein
VPRGRNVTPPSSERETTALAFWKSRATMKGVEPSMATHSRSKYCVAPRIAEDHDPPLSAERATMLPFGPSCVK